MNRAEFLELMDGEYAIGTLIPGGPPLITGSLHAGIGGWHSQHHRVGRRLPQLLGHEHPFDRCPAELRSARGPRIELVGDRRHQRNDQVQLGAYAVQTIDR